MRILVTGATGYVGSRLVTALLEAGHHVVAATRNPDRLSDFGWNDHITAKDARRAVDAAITAISAGVFVRGKPGTPVR